MRGRLMLLCLLPLGLTSTAVAATHTVDQIGFAFEPADLTIALGDTVEWVHSGGFHTVTSGVHPDSSDTGALFDELLDPDHQLVSITFTEPGDVPYFCTPHFLVNMIGIIRVDATNVDETIAASSWSRVKNLYR